MSDLIVGIDKGSKDGDFTALSLRIGDQIHVIPDPFASALLKHIEQQRRYAAALARMSCDFPAR